MFFSPRVVHRERLDLLGLARLPYRATSFESDSRWASSLKPSRSCAAIRFSIASVLPFQPLMFALSDA
jgi:hypothetical protein